MYIHLSYSEISEWIKNVPHSNQQSYFSYNVTNIYCLLGIWLEFISVTFEKFKGFSTIQLSLSLLNNCLPKILKSSYTKVELYVIPKTYLNSTNCHSYRSVLFIIKFLKNTSLYSMCMYADMCKSTHIYYTSFLSTQIISTLGAKAIFFTSDSPTGRTVEGVEQLLTK